MPTIILSLLLLCVCGRAAATEIWDALPALDPTHVQGVYAGQRVCPICRHGYDAGVLVFVPVSLPSAQARTLALNLTPTRLAGANARFRVFVIVTGRAAQPLLDALRLNDARWFVATLEGSALAETRRALGSSWSEDLHAYVFAQRRLLSVWSSRTLLTNEGDERRLDSSYALDFLARMYPAPATSDNSDSAKGELWFAPAQLRPELLLGHANRAARSVCFVAGAARIAEALAFVADGGGRDSGKPWARTDRAGCIRISGHDKDDTAIVTLYRPREPTLVAAVDATAIETGLAIANNEKTSAKQERVLGPCEGCDAVFDAIPTVLSAHERIAPAGEPGEPLRLEGRVVDGRGKPAAGIVVYAYHTAANGLYPRDRSRPDTPATRHGRLRGWARTDANGRYAFDTIRPGSYPNRSDPAHVHMHIIEPGRCTYYIADVFFNDDPRLDQATRAKAATGRGGSGIVRPFKDAAGVWQAARDIALGRNVPGYQDCGKP